MSKTDDISSSDTWSSESDGSYEADFVDKNTPDIDLSNRVEPPEGYLQGGRATGGLRRYQNSLANLIYNIERQHAAMEGGSKQQSRTRKSTKTRKKPPSTEPTKKPKKKKTKK